MNDLNSVFELATLMPVYCGFKTQLCENR